MRLPPPDVVATWPHPNYTNPVTRGPALMIVELITLPIAVICLVLRLFVRIKVIGKTEWDDWIMVAAAMFGIGVTTCVVLAFARYGWDIHVWDLTYDKMIAGRQVSFAAQALFVPATSLAKISILISYLRLAPINSWFRRITFASIWYVGLLNVAFFVVLFAQCIPLSSYWNLSRYDRDCVPEGPALLAQSITAAVADFLVWVLPLPTLYRAKLPLSQRLALILLFSFGLVVVFSACIRTYWIRYVVQETYDVTWEGFHLWIWTAVEVQLGIICGCIPWLKALFTLWKRSQAEVAELTDTSSAARRSRPRRQQTPTSKGGPLVSMDSLSGDLIGETEEEREEERDDGRSRNRDMCIDLESCPSSNPDTIPPTLPNTMPGLAL